MGIFLVLKEIQIDIEGVQLEHIDFTSFHFISILSSKRDMTDKQRQSYLNEVRELQGSHLDTPAPRNIVPKPTPYSLPQDTQNSK